MVAEVNFGQTRDEHEAKLYSFTKAKREQGYFPRPTDAAIEDIIGEYMAYTPSELVVTGLSKNLQELIAREQLKAIKEQYGSHEDYVLWTRCYAGLVRIESNDYS